jgi:O-succinylbenzoic acid--CoA ligase
MMTNKNLGNCHFSTTSLELNNLFEDYSSNTFFNNETYESLKSKILQFGKIDSQNEYIAITDTDPSTFITQFFGIILNKKTPVILAKNISSYSLKHNLQSLDFDILSNVKLSVQSSTDLASVDLNAKFIFFTSGSTGSPKAIVHTLNSIKAHMEGFNEFFQPTPCETYGLNLPINHVGGFMILMRAFLNGAKIHCDMTEKLDYLSLVPTQVETFLSNSESTNFLKNLKALFIGGAPISSMLKEKLIKHKIKFFETYGMTETLSFISLNGIPLKGRKIALNQDGIIQISSPTLFTGYFENKRFVPIDNTLPFTTTDLGKKDKFDNIVFSKRADRIIKSGGEKVSLQVVDDIIKNHTQLKRFHIGSVPDSYWGEKLVVLYDKNVSINEDEIKNSLKNIAESYLVPKHFIPIDYELLKSKISNEMIYDFYLKNIFSFKHIDHGKAETIVLFHGFMEDIDDFSFINKLECFNSFNFLAINLPGHGKTLANSFKNLPNLLEHLYNFINFFSLKTHLIGYSLGGRIASMLARELNPLSLTLISSSLGLLNEEERIIRYQNDLKLFSTMTCSKDGYFDFFNKWYSSPLFGNYREYPFYREEIERKMQHDYHEWEKSLTILSPGKFPTLHENLEALKKIETKKLYIYGEMDQKYGSHALELESNGFKIAKVLGAYHNLHKTHQSELIRELNRFFKLF